MRMLRSRGWVCTRSAMSHGPVDIVAARSGRVLLVQVKTGSSRVRRQELGLLKKWAAEFNATAEVWSFRMRGKIRKTRISVRKKISVIKANSTVGQSLPV